MPGFDYNEPGDWPGIPFERVYLLGDPRPIHVRPYTPAQYRDLILPRARAMSRLPLGDKSKPADSLLRLATVTAVCYVEPTGDARTFRVESGCEADAYTALVKLLPDAWVKQVCDLADALALTGFWSPADTQAQQAECQALHEMLADPESWAHFEWLYARLYGARLAESQEQWGELLTVLTKQSTFDRDLLSALAAAGAASAVR